MHDNWQDQLYVGDNLRILREHVRSGSVDLIYLDPPFNSQTTYRVLLEPEDATAGTQIEAFDDRWKWDPGAERDYRYLVCRGTEPVVELTEALRRLLGPGDMLAYLVMMTARLIEMHRVLKPTGTLYLHCDPTASHYLRVVLDAVFGQEGFLNEIIWKYEGPQSPSPIRFATRHDVILRYAPDPDRVEVSEEGLYIETPMTEAEARKNRYRQDEEGRWYYDTPTGDYTEQSLIQLEELGRIRRTRTGRRRVKYFLQQNEAGLVVRRKKLADVWDDIASLGLAAGSREKTGYPTQKPEALLERIIRADSRPGDLVLDPFCGCGTALVAAERMNRRWIGVDAAHLAITLTRNRLATAFGADLGPYQLKGTPDDSASARALAEHDPEQFELWALGLVEARPTGRRCSALDGLLSFRSPGVAGPGRIIVRATGESVTAEQVSDLEDVLGRKDAQIGVIISLSRPEQRAVEVAESAGFCDPGLVGGGSYPRIQIVTVEELLGERTMKLPPVQGEPRGDRGPRQVSLF